MLKACSRCGKIHDFNYSCNVGKYRKFADTTESRLRSKRAWQVKRDNIKESAFNLCEVCKAQGTLTYTSLEIHHIIKIKDNEALYLDNDNLICLCTYHHKQADRGELSTDYLRELARQRETGEGYTGNTTPPT